MEYNVFMPFFFRFSLIFVCLVFVGCVFYFIFRLTPLVVLYSCKPFTSSQTCLIIFTMDYSSLLYLQNTHKTVASSLWQFISIFLYSYSLLPFMVFFPSLLLILQYVSYVRTFRHKYTISGGCLLP